MQRNAFKTLKILHLAIGAGLFLFTVALIIASRSGHLTGTDSNLERTLQGVAAVLSVGVLLIGFRLFKRKMLQARNSTLGGVARMQQYRTACILWWAMIEAPGLFAGICYYLSGNFAFLALAAFHLLVLLMFMPRKDNIVVLLNLTSKEVDELEGKE
jgi:protein-S-isoprenylcysteine O-methyltransferase Ste14